MKNINHKNFFKEEKKVETVIEETVVKEVPVEYEPVNEKFFYDLTKEEQVELLEKHGLTKKEIKALRTEPERVAALVQFNCLE